ncbi:MAG: lytic murein transglycosylase, partial [Pseudomonadales bacterium]|nr:lytic murein transglycosylase [Pseudomonadales bacterium]
SEPLAFDTFRPASVPAGGRALRHHTRRLPWSEWKEMGVKAIDSEPPADAVYTMVVPEEGESRVYLAGKNFRTILSYNCANKYAVSVGLLADLIVEGAD